MQPDSVIYIAYYWKMVIKFQSSNVNGRRLSGRDRYIP